MAVVSDPENDIETAIVSTSESFMNSGLSALACTNLDSRSGLVLLWTPWMVGRKCLVGIVLLCGPARSGLWGT